MLKRDTLWREHSGHCTGEALRQACTDKPAVSDLQQVMGVTCAPVSPLRTPMSCSLPYCKRVI